MQGVAWNLFLAVIPVVLGYVVAWGLAKKGGKRRLPLALNVLLGAGWLAFLPNSCYLVTEWRHLLLDRRWDAMLPNSAGYHEQMYLLAQWAAFYLLYSGAGALFFTLAVRPVEHTLRRTGRWWLAASPLFFCLVSLGVYMGLIRRLNSWDVLTQPARVWATVYGAISNTRLLVPIVVFAAMLWILYGLVDIWIDAFAARLTRRSARSHSR